MAQVILKAVVTRLGRALAGRGIDPHMPACALVVPAGPPGRGRSTPRRMIAGRGSISHRGVGRWPFSTILPSRPETRSITSAPQVFRVSDSQRRATIVMTGPRVASLFTDVFPILSGRRVAKGGRGS